MTKEDIIRMAREAGLDPDLWNYTDAFERFAALVAAAEREKVAAWMMERGYATGHGDTIEDLLHELEWQIREQEREACAKVPQEFVCSTGLCRFTLTQTGVGIGERGMQAYEEAKKRGWVGISDELKSPQPSEQGVSNDTRQH
jgi:hypothetical protein